MVCYNMAYRIYNFAANNSDKIMAYDNQGVIDVPRRMVGLADCDNFFVSCERTVRPELNGRAVVVLSNNDGCVVARSNEAKAMGIKMGEPAFRVKELISSGKLVALSGNHALYRDISRRVHAIFRRYVPGAIDYSVDESFLDVAGIPLSNLPEIGAEIRRVCRREAGISVTIGFAPSKVLAKVITEANKHSESHIGLLVDKAEIRALLQDMPINEVWGIGRRLALKLCDNGIYTAAQFADMHPAFIRKLLGVTGERIWRELHGEHCIEVGRAQSLQKSISETRTFSMDISDYTTLKSKICTYAFDCGRILRGMNGACREVSVLLRTNRYHPERGVYAPSVTVRLPRPTSDSMELMQAATAGLRQIYSSAYSYKRGGVVIGGIEPKGVVQPSLFDDISEDKTDKLMRVVDKINRNVGVIRPVELMIKGDKHNPSVISFGTPRQ